MSNCKKLLSVLSMFLIGVASLLAGPMTVSSNGRYLMRDGQPVLVVADTGWFIFGRKGEGTFKSYISSRADLGFTAILSTVGDNTLPGVNSSSGRPFTGSGTDIRNRNQAYWDALKRCVDHAAGRGVTVFMTGTWLAYDGSNWYNPLRARTNAELEAYGVFLGNQFKSCHNLTWIMGGDANPVGSYTPEGDRIVKAVVAGIGKADPAKLITFHPPDANGNRSSNWYHGSSWLDYNMIQKRGAAGLQVASLVKADYLRTPTKPTFFAEPGYEGWEGTNVNYMRRSTWYAWTSGSFGGVYGHQDVYGGGLSSMSATGARQIGSYMTRFMRDQAWHSLAPDFNSTVCRGGGGISSADYVASMISSDRRRAVAYTSASVGITVNMAWFAGPVTARWYNTTTGVYTNIIGSPFSNSGTRSFTSTGEAALALTAGSGGPVPPEPPSDRVAPSVPANVSATAQSSSSILLRWSASTDNVGVTGYDIYRGTTKVGSSAATSFSNSGLVANTTYSYTVIARDAAGNSSPASAVASAKTLSSPTTSFTFLKGINLGGSALSIETRSWISYSSALSSGLSISPAPYLATTSLTPSGTSDTNTKTMLNSAIYSNGTFTLNQNLSNGTYTVYLWVMENYQSNYRKFDVKMEGAPVASGIGQMSKGTFQKYGPYTANVADGQLNIQLVKVTGDPHLMGMAIFSGTP